MSLAARLKEIQVDRKIPFEAWIATLDDEDTTALHDAARNPRVSSRALAATIRELDVKIGVEKLEAWRRTNGFPG